jgi:type I restriction enzyme, S subunit
MKKWPVQTLSDVAEIKAGFAWKSNHFSDNPAAGPPVIRIQNLGENDNAVLANYTGPIEPGYWVEKGDLLVSLSGSFKVCQWDGPKALLNQRIVLVRPSKELNPNFTFYQISKRLNEIADSAVGIAVANASMGSVRDMQFSVPPLPEQTRIVKLLDEADALRKLRAQADTRTAALIPALFTKLFGDPTHIETMPWPFKPLGEFAKVSYGLADKLNAETRPEDGTRILTISNVLLNGTIDTKVTKYSIVEPDERAKARLQNFDLLFNWRNGSEAHVGKTAIWEEQIEGEVLHVSFLLKIRADQSKANPYFLWALINRLRSTGYFTRNARMQINTKFNASELSALKLPIPPLPLQKEFAARVTELRALETAQAASRTRLEELFQSMLHKAFRGEL